MKNDLPFVIKVMHNNSESFIDLSDNIFNWDFHIFENNVSGA